MKVKSLTTDEIGLNDALAEAGIQPIETDLAELICQLAGERPSHILVPAIHKNRIEIRDLFRRELGVPDLTDEPAELAGAARTYLREKFLTASVGISGANFAIAETGSVCVVESEGNGRFCTTLPQTLITILGIEKLLPTLEDLEVFLQLLPRSSTGERMNPYTSLWTGVAPGDGPQEFHVVLLDNGRTSVLADEVGRQTLQCIRCSACLNVCPVYETDRGSRLRLRLSGPDRRDPHPATCRHRRGRFLAVRIEPLWRMRRGMPGQDRHPAGARPPSRPRRFASGGRANASGRRWR